VVGRARARIASPFGSRRRLQVALRHPSHQHQVLLHLAFCRLHSGGVDGARTALSCLRSLQEAPALRPAAAGDAMLPLILFSSHLALGADGEARDALAALMAHAAARPEWVAAALSQLLRAVAGSAPGLEASLPLVAAAVERFPGAAAAVVAAAAAPLLQQQPALADDEARCLEAAALRVLAAAGPAATAALRAERASREPLLRALWAAAAGHFEGKRFERSAAAMEAALALLDPGAAAAAGEGGRGGDGEGGDGPLAGAAARTLALCALGAQRIDRREGLNAGAPPPCLAPVRCGAQRPAPGAHSPALPAAPSPRTSPKVPPLPGSRGGGRPRPRRHRPHRAEGAAVGGRRGGGGRRPALAAGRPRL